jgi:hypothetical protein
MDEENYVMRSLIICTHSLSKTNVFLRLEDEECGVKYVIIQSVSYTNIGFIDVLCLCLGCQNLGSVF